MDRLVWEERFSVGVEALDGDHKLLLEQINCLQDACEAGDEGEALEAVFSVLLDYVVHHFRREEALMERVGYPGVPAHKQVHMHLRRKVEEMFRAYQLGQDRQILDALLAFLRSWWRGHILEEDMAYRPYVRQWRRAGARRGGGGNRAAPTFDSQAQRYDTRRATDGGGR